MKLRLGTRIGSGFGMLLLIAGLLGGLAIWTMGNVAEKSTMLENEYVPTVALANSVERWTSAAMFEMRGYGLTGQEKFLSKGVAGLDEVKKHLNKADSLIEKSAHLNTIRTPVNKIHEHINEYEKLIAETHDNAARMAEDWAQLDAAGSEYLQNCARLLELQNEEIKKNTELHASGKELFENLDRLAKINALINFEQDIQMAVLRAQAERAPELIKETRPVFKSITKTLGQLSSAEGQAADLQKKIGDNAISYSNAMEDYLSRWMANQHLATKREQAGLQALTLAKSLAELGMTDTQAVAEDAVASLEQASKVMTGGLIVALLVGVVMAILVTRSITGPVRKGVALAGEIAKGDFSKRLNLTRSDEIGDLGGALDAMADGLQKVADLADQIAAGNLDVEVSLASEKDQLGHALRNMAASLNEVLGHTMVAAEQVATGSAQVSDASQSLSQGSTESASSLEQITSSMAEMASQTRHNAENATQANTLTAEARRAAENGNSQMKQLVGAMGEINDAGQAISRIIKVIDEIAFQTNLLALNAAVEAARAGQHGKGFAVVAEEVRNLAARSARAASETAELIEGSVKKAENGAEIADRTAVALEEIVSGITTATDLVGEIAAASNEQAQGIGQVNQGLGQIDQVTQQNTANAEESAAAAEELSGQATELHQLLSRFRLKNIMRQEPAQPAAARPVTAGDSRMSPMSSDRQRFWRNNEHVPAQCNGMISPGDVIALDDSEFAIY